MPPTTGEEAASQSAAMDKSMSDSEESLLADEDGMFVDGIYIPPAQPPTLSMDPTGPRLIITQIENHFFKSYAENEVLGPFHKCFNAIVGPNGSGKSNVIDSLLFVFGYKASKIRCKKVSVLLHNSDQFQNVQSCTVAIHFAEIIDTEGDGYDVVPGSEFVVSRTANKDNSSFYQLNHTRVQFKDIAMLLKKHGIDLEHNRFLILQGEVEQLAMMKCKGEKEGETGMLEYLEDIIGTSRYKKPLDQVFERTEILSEKTTEKLNRLKLVQKEMDELKEPMEEAVKFLKTENTIVRTKNLIFQKNLKNIKEKEEVEVANREEIAIVQKQFDDQLKTLKAQKQECKDRQDKEAMIYENLKHKKESIKEAFDKANKKDILLQANMTNKIEARKRKKQQIVEEKKKLVKLEAVPEENEKAINEVETRMEQISVEKAEYDAQKEVLLVKVQQETEPLQAEKEVMQTDLAELKEVVYKANSEFTLAETELKLCVAMEEKEQTKLAELQNLLQTSTATIQERTQQVTELKKAIPSLKKQLNEANVELVQVKQEEANLINYIRTERATLEESKSSMQASRSRGRVLDSLLKAKSEGNCPGLFGRLGDLGAINAKYDVAVSTACGPLDNIVVDSVNTAQWCIAFLKTHDIGRGVFIALDQQEHLWDRASTPIQTPENVHRLYDLIKVPDERVKTAFYYALRDTLVAKDLEQASRIAYGARRYRVVTLNGDLIETSGTMSGGGTRVSRGRMGQSVAVSNINPKDLENLEKDIKQMEINVAALRERQTALEALIGELQPKLRAAQTDLEKYTQELQSLKQQCPSLRSKLAEQEVRAKETKADAHQVKKLTSVVEKRKAEVDAATETANQLQTKVDKLSKKIAEKSTDKIKPLDKKIKDRVASMELCRSQITKLRVAVRTAERNYITTKENIALIEEEVGEMENSLRIMKQERQEIEEDANKLLKCVEEITEQLAERESVFTEARQEMDAITKEETKLKSEKIDVDEKIRVFDKKLKEYNAIVNSLRHKLNNLKLQPIINEPEEALEQFSDEKLDAEDLQAAEKKLESAENYLKAAKPNLTAIQEYRKKQVIYTERAKELEIITTKRAEMRKLYDDLRSRRKNEFITGFSIIKGKLKEMYQMITIGGSAELEMVDSYDPFIEGIQFNVRPPKKTWKKIFNLSGGEKTLSSLALLFALHYYKPSPLYIMDEIDAALDFKNVSIVGNYIKDRTKNAQFIIISLRSNMFELCDNLLGIYKTFNTTKSITINPKWYDGEPAEQEPPVEGQSDQNEALGRNEVGVESNNASQENGNDSSEGSQVDSAEDRMEGSDRTLPETPDQSCSSGDMN
uniref:Structural maintenance of chromosomes protein n=1 Tax=Dendroctonus ponderosae TaxID=77166 RepID=A0AAR5Q6Q8_DENPD